MDSLAIPLIHEQLHAYQARGVPDLLANSAYTRKADKLEALQKVFGWYAVKGVVVNPPEVPVNTAQFRSIRHRS
jgi:hypothetical protein